MSMYCLVRKFTVSVNPSDFEATYGRSGSWFKFFESCDDFLGSELMRGENGSYLLVDKWMSKEEYQNFIEQNRAAYDLLIEKNSSFYDSEASIGEYNLLQ